MLHGICAFTASAVLLARIVDTISISLRPAESSDSKDSLWMTIEPRLSSGQADTIGGQPPRPMRF